jgi:hypothetical protein
VALAATPALKTKGHDREQGHDEGGRDDDAPAVEHPVMRAKAFVGGIRLARQAGYPIAHVKVVPTAMLGPDLRRRLCVWG